MESHRRCGWQLWDGFHVPYLPAVPVWAAGTFQAGVSIRIQDTASYRAGWVSGSLPARPQACCPSGGWSAGPQTGPFL